MDNVLNGFNATVFAYGATGYYLVHEIFYISYENQISHWWETNFLVDEKSILNVDVVRGRWRENLYDGRPAGNLVYLFLLPSYVLHICHRTQYRFPETQPSVSIFNNISNSSLCIIFLQICHQTLNEFLSSSWYGQDNPGIMVRALNQLFRAMEESTESFYKVSSRSDDLEIDTTTEHYFSLLWCANINGWKFSEGATLINGNCNNSLRWRIPFYNICKGGLHTHSGQRLLLSQSTICAPSSVYVGFCYIPSSKLLDISLMSF